MMSWWAIEIQEEHRKIVFWEIKKPTQAKEKPDLYEAETRSGIKTFHVDKLFNNWKRASWEARKL